MKPSSRFAASAGADVATKIPLESPLILVSATTPEPLYHAFCGGEICAFTRPEPPGGAPNGDGLALIELSRDLGVLAVADGAGGTPGGNKASGVALKELVRCITEGTFPKGDTALRERILDGFEAANKAVMKKLPGAATTLFVLEVRGRKVRSYHAGDSLLLGVSRGGKKKFHAVPHSPTGYAVESGLMPEAEALLHPENHIVSNLLGSPDLRIEVGSLMDLDVGDTVALASDGLSDNMTLDEISTSIRAGHLPTCARRLAEAATHRMSGESSSPFSKPDDLTVVLYRPQSR
ncbi:MAG TPA: protein phosphatase 2C domain-containing protein [Bdellovibrionota bacterium]|nr:protein phosphatase 2C domain-containing protein [Bdellovibrionota bacterium]